MTDAMLFDETLPTAEFSPCRTWRYVLRRQWAAGPKLGFVLLNPSTADETLDDPTIRRCVGYAKAWGYGGLVLGNLFALRSTDPRALRSAFDPIGPGNNEAMLAIVNECDHGRVICGWGNHGSFLNRSRDVRGLLPQWGARLEALAVTGSGEPGHPLYLRADLQPVVLPA